MSISLLRKNQKLMYVIHPDMVASFRRQEMVQNIRRGFTEYSFLKLKLNFLIFLEYIYLIKNKKKLKKHPLILNLNVETEWIASFNVYKVSILSAFDADAIFKKTK